nr:hypothetical protein [Tanacetum cinerariifolium]
MACGDTTLTKHVVEVRHVWMYIIQNVWRIGKILISKIWWWMVNVSSGGALLWKRGVVLLMLTNKGLVDGNGSNPGGGLGKPRGGQETCGGGVEGNGSNPSGGFKKPGGGRETRGGGDGLEGPGG